MGIGSLDIEIRGTGWQMGYGSKRKVKTLRGSFMTFSFQCLPMTAVQTYSEEGNYPWNMYSILKPPMQCMRSRYRLINSIRHCLGVPNHSVTLRSPSSPQQLEGGDMVYKCQHCKKRTSTEEEILVHLSKVMRDGACYWRVTSNWNNHWK